ncbi:TRAP transporter large permease [Oceanobacillus sp. CAU 1775]
MTIAVLFGSFAIFLLLSVPVGIALGISTVVTIIYSGSVPIEFLAQGLVTSVDSFPILAVPFFILAGEIMGKGGISERLFRVANSMVGNITGGFAIATIVTCMFFAAISGSAPATVAAIGGIMIPAMVKLGYDRTFAAAVVAAAGSLGVIIPPSIPMVIYGTSASASIGDLFIAGIIPGISIALLLSAYSYYYAKKKGFKGNGEKFSIINILKSIWEAKWAILIPVIILGGIYGGIFTPTEAAAVAVVVGLIASLLIYKELKLKDLPRILIDSSLTSATVLIIIGTATAFGRLLTVEQIPNQIAEGMLAISENRIVIMLLIIILLLIVGCFMDTLAAIIILTPILLPMATSLGYDPVHFGIIMVVGLAVGFITPPVGVNLFVAQGISGVSFEALVRRIIPFIIVLVVALLIVTFVPQLSLFLIR